MKEFIGKVIAEEGRISGDLNFILTNDETLKKMNLKYLKHNYFTDVISFGWGEGDIVAGEVYISVDTVKRNAQNYKVSYNNEIVRVIVHGVLHLCGYNDATSDEKREMRKNEEIWLEKFNSF
jgi:probable rRNA maturation factor